jgi:hypothetical protein
MFQRLGAAATPPPTLHEGQLMTPGALSKQLQELFPVAVAGSEVLGSVSGVLPSIIRSIDPELSMRSSTLGSGGLVSVCWAPASPVATSSATAANAAVNDRGQHWASVLIVESFLTSGIGRGRR